ncbi:hypothetical protein J3T26_22140 [Salmonella enterica]|uniref:hypothetical protein n=1 Tax=Salmonella enterica TaxID=28901 RepID=UPI0021D509F1|nr:hypothetical protein [Salmonella enterica]MCU7123383.1 hypothetical protein [Salmonella enterica]
MKVDLRKLSIGWIDTIETRNDSLIMSVVSFADELKIKCDGVIFLSVHYRGDDELGTEFGTVVEVRHEYRSVRSEDIPLHNYYYQSNIPLNIVRLEGDFIVNLVCKSISTIGQENE